MKWHGLVIKRRFYYLISLLTSRKISFIKAEHEDIVAKELKLTFSLHSERLILLVLISQSYMTLPAHEAGLTRVLIWSEWLDPKLHRQKERVRERMSFT